MGQISFLDKDGTFTLKNPESYSYLYFPIAGEVGLKSAITPRLAGDAKIDKNTFLLEPVSAENLHNNRSSRNFWCSVEGKGCWSATGVSAEEYSNLYTDDKEKSELRAGLMWHEMTRVSEKYGLCSRITSFVPVNENVEIMHVELTNIGDKALEVTPTAVIPIYARSADNIRDHRHVTSLLHRIKTQKYGVEITPTLSFDERGHQKNDLTYFVCGTDEDQNAPTDFYPTVDYFVEDGGSFECPYAVIKNTEGVTAGANFEGTEAVGGLRFSKRTLPPKERTGYIILIGVTENKEEITRLIEQYCGYKKAETALETVREYWKDKVNVSYETGDAEFNQFMKWVSLQPILRRIYGCSFLPHHDYGKGGRGWRDLWQDCLALLIMNPDGVRQMLIDNFGGVRIDGTNATIIGNKQGEFIADRNNITRVWSDHGVWPFVTTKLYIDQTGDIDILMTPVTYFKDKQICRGTQTDTFWSEEIGCLQQTKNKCIYEGTILEHLLVQNLTSFYEVGEHNIIKLRGADWNDALDMANENGEGVAFSTAYAGNLSDLAELLLQYHKKTGTEVVYIAEEMGMLLADDERLYSSVEQKQTTLARYLEACRHEICGRKVEIAITKLAENLVNKSNWLMRHIRKNEWVTDKEGNGWFNGYYDNNKRQVEGEFDKGVRMMLTSQVFSIMSGTADTQQIDSIVKSADKYLYCEDMGGYRLNTNFGEIKTDLGRMFGFAYGEKENGAVFSHMAVMYANALYKQGFVKEGFRSLNALKRQSMNFEVSRIYPGIPEYFNAKGRGMYHYLTGAASWYMMTVITEMFGVRGELGNMVLEPKLLVGQFDDRGLASISMMFAGKKWKVTYSNLNHKDYGEYVIDQLLLDGEEVNAVISEHRATIKSAILNTLNDIMEHVLFINLL